MDIPKDVQKQKEGRRKGKEARGKQPGEDARNRPVDMDIEEGKERMQGERRGRQAPKEGPRE